MVIDDASVQVLGHVVGPIPTCGCAACKAARRNSQELESIQIEAENIVLKVGNIEVVCSQPSNGTTTRLLIDGKPVTARRAEFIFEVGKVTICRVDIVPSPLSAMADPHTTVEG